MDSNSSLLVETYIENLIQEIEKRPAIYKKNLKEYSDVNLKKRLWEEVCEAVVPNWNQLNAEDKTKQGHELQKKWANLRTCFRRELNAQKSTKSGQAATKRRKYVYFEQLLFLLPCMEKGPSESCPVPEGDDDDDAEEPAPTTSKAITGKKKTNAPPIQTDVDKALLKALNKENTIDEDLNFALSLVPSLKNLTAEEKLDAKIAILSIFKQIRQARRVQATSQSTVQQHSYNVLQQPMSSFPVYQRLQPFQTQASPTPSADQYVQSPGNSNDTVQSYISNFTEDSQSQLYDL